MKGEKVDKVSHGFAQRLREGLSRTARNPRARALLDNPRVFWAVRYALIGSQKKTRKLLQRELEAGPSDSVLDVCCGTGDFADLIEGPYLGIDLNEQFIQFAKKRYVASPNKRFEVMDATRMKLETRSYSRAMLVNVMHHFEDDLNRGILSEISRATQERVVILDTIPNPDGWLKRLVVACDRGDYVRPLEDQLTLIGEILNIERHYMFDVGLGVQVLFVCSPNIH